MFYDQLVMFAIQMESEAKPMEFSITKKNAQDEASISPLKNFDAMVAETYNSVST